jgi:hypothetical protein
MLFWIMLLFKSCGKPTMQVCMGFCNIELQWSYIQCNWLTGYAYFYCEALHCPAFWSGSLTLESFITTSCFGMIFLYATLE